MPEQGLFEGWFELPILGLYVVITGGVAAVAWLVRKVQR